MSDLEYGSYEAGAESGELEQLHTAEASEADFNSDFSVYEAEHTDAESTDFQQGSHVEIDNGHGGTYEETNFTNYSNDSFEHDSVFAAEGSESAHIEQGSELDALRHQFESNFAAGTEFHGDAGQLGVASN